MAHAHTSDVNMGGHVRPGFIYWPLITTGMRTVDATETFLSSIEGGPPPGLIPWLCGV